MHYNERIKRQVETKAERCKRIEEQMTKANETAAKKYKEQTTAKTMRGFTISDYVNNKPEPTQPKLPVSNEIISNVRPTTFVPSDSMDIEIEHIATKALTRAERIEQQMQSAKITADNRYAAAEFSRKMYSGQPIAPPVVASNQRALDAARQRAKLEEASKTRIADITRNIENAKFKADAVAEQQLAAMTDKERKDFFDDIETKRQYNENLKLPEQVRTGKMTMEEYEVKIRRPMLEYQTKVRAGEIQPHKGKRNTKKELAHPFAHLQPRVHSIPLKPPVSNNSYIHDAGEDLDLTAEITQDRITQQQKDTLRKKQEIGKSQHITVLASLMTRPELLGFLTLRLKANTIDDLLAIHAKTLQRLCNLNNLRFTYEDYNDIRTELRTKFSLAWKKTDLM